MVPKHFSVERLAEGYLGVARGGEGVGHCSSIGSIHPDSQSLVNPPAYGL